MNKTFSPERRDPKRGLLPKKKGSPRQLGKDMRDGDKNLGNISSYREQKYGQKQLQKKYRKSNLSWISSSLLQTLSMLTVLDLSYNNLNDLQIQLLMNTCTKLKIFSIQGNSNIVIPSSIWKIKNLYKFRHDWLQIYQGGDQLYEDESNIKKIQILVQKLDMVVKVNKVVGLEFCTYWKEMTNVKIDLELIERIEKSKISEHVKKHMLKYLKQCKKMGGQLLQSIKPIIQTQQYFIICKSMCKFDLPKKQSQSSGLTKNLSLSSNVNIAKQLSQIDTDCGSHKIKIEEIKNIWYEESTIEQQLCERYQDPGYPFHQLLANFDTNSRSCLQIDKLLLKGYNPNQYNAKGLSPYHVCIIKNQKKGLEHLLSISGKNPGFFDLEMPEQKYGRNILHYCVFMKNYCLARELILFGFPLGKRDCNGARVVHLVDQNYQFTLLLRKMIKRIERNAISSVGSAGGGKYMINQKSAGKKRYEKHPQRIKTEVKFRIKSNTNEKLMEMFEAAVSGQCWPRCH